MKARIGLLVTCIIGLVSIACAFLFYRQFEWLSFAGPLTMVVGIIAGSKFPLYVSKPAHRTISVTVTALGVIWALSLFKTHAVINEYWIAFLCLCGMAFPIKAHPTETASKEINYGNSRA